LLEASSPFKDVADMTFLLDMDPEISLRRVGVRGEEISKFEDRSFLEQVRSGYLALAEEFGFVRIDASKSAEDVADEVFERIQEVL
jgi:dTMP kinase